MLERWKKYKYARVDVVGRIKVLRFLNLLLEVANLVKFALTPNLPNREAALGKVENI